MVEAPAIAKIVADWNPRGLSSSLIEITATLLTEPNDKTGKPPVGLIIGEPGQKGTGRLSVIEAQRLGIGAKTQRDFFGAHTDRRFDPAGAHHHIWPTI